MISHNFRKLCNYTSVCYDNTTLSNCCFCIFLPKNYKLSKRTILKKDVWEKNKFWVPTRNQNSDFKILHSDALPLSLRDSMVSEVHYKVHIWHAFFFVSRSWLDIKHLYFLTKLKTYHLSYFIKELFCFWLTGHCDMDMVWPKWVSKFDLF